MLRTLHRVPRWTAVLALLGAMAVQASAAPYEKAIPGDAVVFLNVKGVKELKEKFKASNGSELLRDPAMQPFVSGVKEQLKTLLQQLQDMTGVNPLEILRLPSGQISFAVSLNPKDPRLPPTIYFLADCAGNEAQLKSLIDRATTALEQQGVGKQANGPVTIIEFEPGAPEGSQLCFELKGSVLIVSNYASAVSSISGSLEGGAASSLATNSTFADFRSTAGGESDIEAYVNLDKIVALAMQQGGQQAQAVNAMLGLNAFQSAGMTISFMTDKYDQQVQLFLNTQGQSPIFNLFNMPTMGMVPEKWVPENIIQYFSVNWNLKLFYKTLTGLVNMANPQAMDQINAQLAGPDPNNPIFNIESDFIEPFGNRITAIQDSTTVDGLPMARTLVAWELKDSKRVKGLINRLIDMAGGNLPINKKTVKGVDVYTFPLGDMIKNQAPGQDQVIPIDVIGLTVTDSHLMFATHIELMDQVLATEVGLAESPQYKQIAANFPSKTSAIGFLNGVEQGRSSWGMLKSGKFVELIRNAWANDPNTAAILPILDPLLDSLNGSNLPEFDAVKKYFVDTGSYVVMDDKGVRVMSFSLKK